MKPTARESMEGEKGAEEADGKEPGMEPQTHRRRCQRGGTGEQRQLCGHQKRPRLENGCHRRHGVDAPKVPLVTVVGGSIRDGGRSPKSKRMEGRL